MSLKIKKSYPDPQNPGRFIEVEGTEAEIESYEKKQNKKNESSQKKRDILHGKKAKNFDMDELKRFLVEELQKLAAIREVHHWYYNNGWWWRPWWLNGSWTYIYSQTQPTAAFNGATADFKVSTNATDLSKQIGVSTNDISNKSNFYSTSGITYATNATYVSSPVTLTAASNGTNTATWTASQISVNDDVQSVLSVVN
jgi:hypothetical protein